MPKTSRPPMERIVLPIPAELLREVDLIARADRQPRVRVIRAAITQMVQEKARSKS